MLADIVDAFDEEIEEEEAEIGPVEEDAVGDLLLA